MSIFRNILIVGLFVCVAYNGYLIYRNHTSIALAEPEEKLTEAPLFSSEAFTTLAENRSQVSVQQAPTIVTPSEEVQSEEPVSNPVLAPPPQPEEQIATVSAEALELSELSGQQRPQTPSPSVETASTFDENWTAIQDASASFQLAKALALINDLTRRSDLTDEQHAKIIQKGNELAETVVFAASKHLALPAHTFRPGSTLEEIAQNHQLPISFLRAINRWADNEGPTAGDSIKVLQGPVALQVDLPRSGILVSIGNLYAGWISINKRDIRVPTESQLTLQEVEDETHLFLGDVAVILAESDDPPSQNTVAVASKDWQLLRNLAASSTTIGWTPENLVEPPIAASPSNDSPAPMPVPEQVQQPKVVLQPVDALKLEVFTPVGKAVQGHPVRYGLQITNLSENDSDQIQVVVNLSEGVEPKEVEGHPGRIDIGQAIFDPLTIPAGESVRLTVVVATLQPGDHVIRPELQCARPVTKYATEIQLQVVAAEPISTEPLSAEAEQGEQASPSGPNAMAEAPGNPAEKTR